MYLHIGNNKIVRVRDIVGIFDADSATVSAAGKRFLSLASKAGKLSVITSDIPKSFVVMADGEVFMCQLNAAALRNRMG